MDRWQKTSTYGVINSSERRPEVCMDTAFFFMARQPYMGLGLLVSLRFHGHTHLRHTTVGRTPLDEGPARRRETLDIYSPYLKEGETKFWFDTLQLILGFCAPYWKKLAEIIFFGSQTRVTYKTHTHRRHSILNASFQIVFMCSKKVSEYV
jgi:hypothetical protein